MGILRKAYHIVILISVKKQHDDLTHGDSTKHGETSTFHNPKEDFKRFQPRRITCTPPTRHFWDCSRIARQCHTCTPVQIRSLDHIPCWIGVHILYGAGHASTRWRHVTWGKVYCPWTLLFKLTISNYIYIYTHTTYIWYNDIYSLGTKNIIYKIVPRCLLVYAHIQLYSYPP